MVVEKNLPAANEDIVPEAAGQGLRDVFSYQYRRAGIT